MSSSSSSAVLDAVINSPEFASHVMCDQTLPAVPARCVPFPAGLNEALAGALRRRGIEQVYTHQAEAFSHVVAGRNTVVVTPTASGKTLCYNLPVLHTLLGDPSARALYLFPTKALSQDQQSELNELIGRGTVAKPQSGFASGVSLARNSTLGYTEDPFKQLAQMAAWPDKGNADSGFASGKGRMRDAPPPGKPQENPADLFRQIAEQTAWPDNGVHNGDLGFTLDGGRCGGTPPLRGVAEDQTEGDVAAPKGRAISTGVQCLERGGRLPPSRSAVSDSSASNLASLRVATYDGDTPGSVRVSARDKGRIIISNPDMLHAGILPNHTKWIAFFSNLRFIVIDEAHAYRGVFGSHVANVVRRLKRIARFYGAKPVFILSSATIGNPRELAELLTGERVELVDNNGAPRGERRIVLYNPPLVDAVQGIRVSSLNESRRWMLALLKAGVKTILFAHSRIKTEVAASYVNEDIKNINTDNGRIRVEAYRGGLLPNERREIEKGLRDGSIQGVVSTNALELGIDIGGLDASIVAGFPGSFNSFWQQSGRAGRRGGTSVSVFIASSAPLDQFLMNDPNWFFGKAAEEARLDADNPYIMSDHVKCAAFELPFREERFAVDGGESFGGGTKDALSFLEEEGIVRRSGGAWHWSDRSYPAEGISLRSAAADNVVIIDVTKGRNAVIGEMDRPSAKEMLFKNAVYIHRGEQFIVQDLDMENRKALVMAADVNYFTDGLVKTDIKVLSEDEQGTCGDAASSDDTAAAGAFCDFSLGDVLVRSQVTKFKKLRFHTHENIGFGEIDLPEEEMQTRALILRFPAETRGGKTLRSYSESEKGEALRGLGTMVRQIAGVFLLCDRSDLGIAERVRDPHFDTPALYIYDKYPGGTGLAEALSRRTGALLKSVQTALARCPCKNGCPSCVGPHQNKAGTAELLKALEREPINN